VFRENTALAAGARRGCVEDEAELIKRNEGLVRSIAARFTGRGVDMEDLVQLGMIGMIRAARSFDDERGCAFSTYAVPLIMGEIRRFLRDDGLIKVSRERKRLGSRLLYEKEKYSLKYGHDPRISELAEICGVSVEEAAEALCCATPPRSLSEPAYEDGDAPLSDLIPSPDGMSRETEVIALRETVRRMPLLWRKIVALRYDRDLSQDETARILGLTQVKISREEKKIFEYLRRELS